MADFKRQTQLQKYMLARLVNAVREYLGTIEKPQQGKARHRRTTLVFVGDRYKPMAIDSHYTRLKQE